MTSRSLRKPKEVARNTITGGHTGIKKTRVSNFHCVRGRSQILPLV